MKKFFLKIKIKINFILLLDKFRFDQNKFQLNNVNKQLMLFEIYLFENSYFLYDMNQYVENVLINVNQMLDNDLLINEFFLILFHYQKHSMQLNNFLL